MWIKTPLDKPILCLLVVCMLSTGFSLHRSTSFWSMILLLNYLAIYYLAIHTVRTRFQLRRLVYLIIGVSAFLSIFGVFKRFGTNPFPWWDYTDISQHADRFSATFGNPDHLAGYMEMALPIVLGSFLLGYKGGNRLLMVYIAFMVLTALILSLSRGGWLGAAVSLGFMATCLLFDQYFKRKTLIISLMAGVLAISFIVLSTTPVLHRLLTVTKGEFNTSFHTRLMIWAGVWEMIKEYPFLGTGPGTFAFVYMKYEPPALDVKYTMAHNDYLHFIAEAGLSLSIVMAWIIIALYRNGFKKLKNPSRLVRGTTLGALSGITAILVHSISDFNLHIPANALLFTVLAASVAAPLPEPYEV